MKTAGRYEIREVLGEGGMGVVYRAFDPVMSREVTLKTIRNLQDKTALDLFKRECAVLASMAHPNIIEIYDVGESEEAGGKRPYFVMPLLRGVTLDQLIKASSPRLTVERSIQIVSQMCRGLQAAHDLGLVHRDIKPSNVFVLDDDSVKVIDFGVAHLVDQRTATGLKGTLLYMAPEQLLLKPPTPLSDQFSIAVVTYEMLAHRHPFSVPGFQDLAQAILNHEPAPVCDLNQSVSRPVSQVIRKAMAKEPIHRFADVRNFADCLYKALRNEPIEIFDETKIEPRLRRARKALESGDLEFAGEIVRELEAESYLNPEITQLRRGIDDARRLKTVQALLETARRRFEEEEYLLALQKVQEVLNLDPPNADALTLRADIESKRNSAQIEGSLRLAQQHLENHAFDMARQAIQRILELRPRDTRAQALLAEVDRQEQESQRLRQEKEKAYSSALEAFNRGELSSALSKLERVLEIDRRAPYSTSPEHSASYQKLYEEVRGKRDQVDARYSDAKRNLSEGNLNSALAECEEVLKEYPNNVMFQSLKYDIDEARREEISAYIAKVEKEVAAEPDVNRKVAILESATQKFPQEERFAQTLARARARRDLVQGIVVKAMLLEDAGQFSDALGQWEVLRSTYPQYPGLDVEIERVTHRREEQGRADAKAQWVAQIDQALSVHNYTKAASLADEALTEFPDDPELAALKKNSQQATVRREQSQQKLDEGRELLRAGNAEEGLEAIREASRLDPQSQVVRNALLDALLQQARIRLESDWQSADALIGESQDLDPDNPLARSLRTLIQDKRENREITVALSTARERQARGELATAIAGIDAALLQYPGRERLMQLRAALMEQLPEVERAELRKQDLEQLKQLAQNSMASHDPKELESIFARTRLYTMKYSSDTEFLEPMTVIESNVLRHKTAAVPVGESIQPATPGAAAVAPPRAAALTRLLSQLAVLLNPRFLKLAISGTVVVTALIIVGLFWPRPHKQVGPVAASSQVARVILDGATAKARVTDSAGQDVTARITSGLPAGTYRLTDSKPGFRPIAKEFKVDSSARMEEIVAVDWVALPVYLSLEPVGSGTWSLDSVNLPPDTPAEKEIGDGSHTLSWSDGTVEVTLPFTVAGGKAGLGEWRFSRPTPTLALAVTVGQDGLFARKLNIPKFRYQTADGNTRETDEYGPIAGPAAGQELTFQHATDGSVIGKTGAFDPAKETMYVFLRPGAAAARAKRRAEKPQEQTPPDREASQTPPPKPEPPKLSPEEQQEKLRQERLRQLGLSEEDIKRKKQ